MTFVVQTKSNALHRHFCHGVQYNYRPRVLLTQWLKLVNFIIFEIIKNNNTKKPHKRPRIIYTKYRLRPQQHQIQLTAIVSKHILFFIFSLSLARFVSPIWIDDELVFVNVGHQLTLNNIVWLYTWFWSSLIFVFLWQTEYNIDCALEISEEKYTVWLISFASSCATLKCRSMWLDIWKMEHSIIINQAERRRRGRLIVEFNFCIKFWFIKMLRSQMPWANQFDTL